jgi:cytochrome c biogenesis protein CcmG, thiol:disulfide interchange protein DsbE
LEISADAFYALPTYLAAGDLPEGLRVMITGMDPSAKRRQGGYVQWHVLCGVMLLFLGSSGLLGLAQERPFVTPHPTVLAPGQPAPDFVAPDLAGQMLTLEAYRGRPVILNFWATWCVPCRREMPVLQAVHEAQKDAGLVILSLSQDVAGSQDTVRVFLATVGSTFPALLDADGAIATRYNVSLLPSTVFIHPTGTIAAVHYGPLSQWQIERYLEFMRTQQG